MQIRIWLNYRSSAVKCQRRLIWSCSEFKQRHYQRPSFAIGFLPNSKICLARRNLLQMFFKPMPKVSNRFHIFRKERSLTRNKKRRRAGKSRVQKSPLVFKLLFSLGGFSWDQCSRWLFMSRPLGSLSGCTWHSQGPLFYDPHLRLAQNIQHFAFPWWRFLP